MTNQQNNEEWIKLMEYIDGVWYKGRKDALAMSDLEDGKMFEKYPKYTSGEALKYIHSLLKSTRQSAAKEAREEVLSMLHEIYTLLKYPDSEFINTNEVGYSKNKINNLLTKIQQLTTK